MKRVMYPTRSRTVVENLDADEDFVWLFELAAANTQALTSTIKDCLIRLNLPLEDCRSQCYDGANGMTGSKGEVQSMILKDNPKAHYVHCHAHALNLAVADPCQESQILKETGAVVKQLCSLITYPKRNHTLKSLKECASLEVSDGKPGSSVSFCPTRWIVRAETSFKVLANYSYLLELWPLVRAESSDPNQ
ncbi:zinc finger MYM-type protein 1-like [Watersipora subatra]|uniref:zinc finger MYM-type protein 1-like n=1 Tax=Watersipora subatra TaxID=2589382 RepID=UPI00355C89DE